MPDGRQARSKSATMRMFGAVLQAVRRRAGVSREQLAEAAKYSVDMICSVEQGRRKPSIKLIDTAEELCDGGGLLREAAKHIVQSKFPDWFEEYAKYEEECRSLEIYQNHVVPGLFQTEEYALAVFRSERPLIDDEEIEQGVAARLERQKLLTRTPPAVISAVLEQVVLERWIGGKDVMRGQMHHLLDLSKLRNVDIQIMPTRRETHAGLAGPLYVLETKDHERFVYFEGQKGVMLSGAKDVSDVSMRSAMLRSQALTPEDSVSMIGKMLGEL
ncbi:helix-turn-helix transcriptional regulator [Streptomyces sp. UNOB3_S3]|uniref:helix-turn-helix domain-containing protein n=1 Tax=Streptomyces sp. UNOB3_S3 TaxID=2871682 RepID=UPI001E5A62A9|nr:helix-turn-helix transcriptional regulator [Streptomyces sp. UNOB3_S3]MCC3779912.1 helix-turn-helix transcriptional regulator [Streptomyces sp. UNOB3_S3]